MQLLILGHPYHYEMENLTRVFFPGKPLRVLHEPEAEPDGERVVTGMEERGEECRLYVRYEKGGEKAERETTVSLKDLAGEEKEPLCELCMANLLFDLLCSVTGDRPSWGILTGVRPVKLLRRLILADGGEKAAEHFRRELRVSEEKIKLALDCERNEAVILKRSRPESYSLYLSIPFCPTRCAYCSFVSQSIERAGKLIAPYLERLQEELRETAAIAKGLGLRLETVYIGGGTPTILSAEQLSRLIGTVTEAFDTACLREFTVEAGRPDTLDREKLLALRGSGVTRISINPQTLNDQVLEAIGRRHTGAQTLNAFDLARDCGMDNINMDLIAGLPGDTLASFRDTLERVIDLSPESITVHTLSIKKSARLTGEDAPVLPGGPATAEMVKHSAERLSAAGYIPYYLYRQSKMLGNLENVGWSKPGFESDYNVYIMDETHTILACGAGGVTKLRQPGGDHIQRIFNYKFPYEYCNRFEDILTRKKGIEAFYEKFGQFPSKR